MAAFHRLLPALAALLLFAACKPTERVVYSHTVDSVSVHLVDTLLKVKTERDSVYVRDSVFVSQYAKGDTVFRDRTLTQWRERVLVRRDTLWRERTATERAARADTVYIYKEAPAAASLARRAASPASALVVALSVAALLLVLYRSRRAN